MGNAFMPSVAASLNQGSSNSLLEIMQQRLLEQEMQKQLFAQQRQQQQDMIGTGMRLQSQDLAERRLASSESARTAAAEQRAREAAAKARQEGNERGVASMAAEAIRGGASRQDIATLAMESGGRVQSWMLPKEPEAPKPTLAERLVERKALRTADKEVDARFKEPTGTGKAEKDNAKIPIGVKAAIRASIRNKNAGWATADEAFESFGRNWNAFLADHPDLDRGEVIKFIGNQYNEHLTPSKAGKEDSSGLGAGALDRINKMRAAKGLPPL